MNSKNKAIVNHRIDFTSYKKHFRNITLSILIAISFHTVAFGQSALIKTIYFSNNSCTINNKYHSVLNKLAKQMTLDTFGYLKIIGFADTKGPDELNNILSQKRAEAVYNYLVSKSAFDTTKVMITWYGASADIYDLHFPQANKQHRCVDILVQFYNTKPGK
ncbi:MAG: OmpA family protein [Ferruginibacter sp.]